MKSGSGPSEQLAAPLSGPPSGVRLPFKPVLLLGLPDWAIENLCHVLINDLVYASTSRYKGNGGDEMKLKTLAKLKGKELLKLTLEQGGSVILPEDEVLDQRTGEVDTGRLRQLDGQDYQAIVVDDTCFIREPEIARFVLNHYDEKGVSVVIMALEGIFDISSVRSAFNVNWKFVAYTKYDIKLTDAGKDILDEEAFPFEHKYTKANFIVGEQELFTEYQHPEDYEDEEDYPNGPPHPKPGSPIVTVERGDKSVSYFGFVNPLDVSYGAIVLKLCYAANKGKGQVAPQQSSLEPCDDQLNFAAASRTSCSKMTGFTIGQVREIASLYDYQEIELNEVSRLLSFRKDSTRINVYFTTGTVGTCLNHPTRGKTQLFRRDIDASQLEEIFKNPRSHTGKGYYRKHLSQKWKTNKGTLECDSARRWRFVASASGLSSDEREIDSIAFFFSYLDRIFWEPNSPPDIGMIRYACGSLSGLFSMLLDVAIELDGAARCCSRSDVKDFKDGKIDAVDIETNDSIRECCNKDAFLQEHHGDVVALKAMLEAFRREVRIEVMQWLVNRHCCGLSLYDGDYELLETSYSSRVLQTHDEYSGLMYPKKSKLCSCCGVVTS